MFDIRLILIFCIVAFMMRRLDYPLASAVLALVQGPIAEPTLRQSLLLSPGDPLIFFTRAVSGPIPVIALILNFLPALKLLRHTCLQPPARILYEHRAAPAVNGYNQAPSGDGGRAGRASATI